MSTAPMTILARSIANHLEDLAQQDPELRPERTREREMLRRESAKQLRELAEALGARSKRAALAEAQADLIDEMLTGADTYPAPAELNAWAAAWAAWAKIVR